MKRKPKLTKRERRALEPERPRPQPKAAGHVHGHRHIHCVACGRHIDPPELESGRAVYLRCDHGSTFASCAGCAERSRGLLVEHDRTGEPVKTAAAWH